MHGEVGGLQVRARGRDGREMRAGGRGEGESRAAPWGEGRGEKENKTYE